MAKPTCSVVGCTGRHKASRGFCRTHYGRWRKYGDPLIVLRPVGLPLLERFRRQYTVAGNGCWLWNHPMANGYGAIHVDGKRRWAHRFGYELLVGPIPEGLTLDHLCRTPACVNPEHLEPVTHAENVRRGVAPTAQNARKTHCKYGHPFSAENTYHLGPSKRYCRTCRRAYMHEYQQRRSSKKASGSNSHLP